jgi:hypothetical protein
VIIKGGDSYDLTHTTNDHELASSPGADASLCLNDRRRE